jgi:hypothetical protein
MSMQKEVNRRNRRFTLVELKTFSIIVGILMAVSNPLHSADARKATAAADTESWADSEDKVVLWASNPLEKIFRGTPPPKEADTKGVSLEALRNEYEPAQVCISSHDFKGPVRVKVNPLIHRSGKHRIESVNARFVGYVTTPRNVPGSERFSDCPDAYPDPLILDEEVVLGRQQTQPVWLTVKIPKDALPGEYDGSIEVTTTAGHAAFPLKLAIHLTVYPMALPDTTNFWLGTWGGDTKLAEAFGIATRGEWQKGNYTPEYLAFVKSEAIRNRYEHRATAFSDQPFWPSMDVTKVFWKDGGYVYDYALLDKLISTVEEGFHHGRFRITCLGIAEKTKKEDGKGLVLTSTIKVLNPDGSDNAEKSFIRISTDDPRYLKFIGDFFEAMSLHLQEKDWLEKVYFKVIDEPGKELAAPALRLNEYIKNRAPDIRLNSTFWDPKISKNMAKAEHIDLPIITSWTLSLDPQTVQEETRKGRDFWLYNDSKIRIDKPSMEARKMGWLCYFHGARGYMHWAYSWKSNPWENAFDKTWGFGAHFIVYPDKKRKKIVDSIRWEMLRETAEDYDALCMLKAAGGDSKEFAQLVKDLAESEQDPKSFYQIRHRLLLELNRLSQ